METREAERPTVITTSPSNGRSHEPVQNEVIETGNDSGPRKRIIFGVLGAIVAVLLLVWGVKWFLYARVHEGTDDARIDADTVAITSKIPERIDSILVDTNQPVKKGQTLIVLDSQDETAKAQTAQAQYDLALANLRSSTTQNQGGVTQAVANVANAQAQVPLAQAGVTQANAQLRAAQAQLPAAQAAYDRASADYNRVRSLVSTGDLPRQQLDAANASLAAAAAQLRSAQDQVGVASASVTAAQQRVAASSAGVNAAQGGVTTAQGKLDQASDPSQVEAARAQLNLAKQNLAYTKIVSPIDGYIGEKNAEVGQTVGPGTTLLAVIPSASQKIYVTANFKETQVGSMRPGQQVDVKVDAYKGVTFTGHVVSINPASQNTYALVPAQNATGNFVKVTQRIPVRIAIDDQRPDMPLRPGMSVEANVKVR